LQSKKTYELRFCGRHLQCWCHRAVCGNFWPPMVLRHTICMLNSNEAKKKWHKKVSSLMFWITKLCFWSFFLCSAHLFFSVYAQLWWFWVLLFVFFMTMTLFFNRRCYHQNKRAKVRGQSNGWTANIVVTDHTASCFILNDCFCSPLFSSNFDRWSIPCFSTTQGIN
jgi:hypothetical protein